MKSDRDHGGFDGTKLFEELCCTVINSYFGNRSSAMVFGTASTGTFSGKVTELIKQLGEGVEFKNPDGDTPDEKDGRIDVCVWNGFSDGLGPQLIGFGQCKTGTTWRESLGQLQPEHFCATWMKEQPILLPVKVFLVAEALGSHRREKTLRGAGLFFDRMRIMDYLNFESLSTLLLQNINTWVDSALVSYDVIV